MWSCRRHRRRCRRRLCAGMRADTVIDDVHVHALVWVCV